MEKPLQQASDLFANKYKIYSAMMYRLCMIHLGNREDAEEAMQEAFIKLIYKSPHFSSQEHEKAWFIKVTVNICRDMLRSLWRKKVVKMEEVEVFNDNPSEMYIIEEVLRLPTKYKAVIYLHYFEDYSVKQISDILKISESAIKMRLKRGREILKIELERE